MITSQQIDAGPRDRVMDRDVAMRLAEREYAKVADLFQTLTSEQWVCLTNCAPWDVRDMAGHMLGMMQMAASVPETLRQQVVSQRRAKKAGGLTIDAMTALQVEKNAGLSTAE